MNIIQYSIVLLVSIGTLTNAARLCTPAERIELWFKLLLNWFISHFALRTTCPILEVESNATLVQQTSVAPHILVQVHTNYVAACSALSSESSDYDEGNDMLYLLHSRTLFRSLHNVQAIFYLVGRNNRWNSQRVQKPHPNCLLTYCWPKTLPSIRFGAARHYDDHQHHGHRCRHLAAASFLTSHRPSYR